MPDVSNYQAPPVDELNKGLGPMTAPWPVSSAAGEGWSLTERWAHPAFQRLLTTSRDPGLPVAIRDGASRKVLELLRVRLDVESDEAFRAQLVLIGEGVDRSWRELEPRIRAAKRRR